MEDPGRPSRSVLRGGVEEMGINLQDCSAICYPSANSAGGARIRSPAHLAQEEAQNLIDMEEVIQEAIRRSENADHLYR